MFCDVLIFTSDQRMKVVSASTEPVGLNKFFPRCRFGTGAAFSSPSSSPVGAAASSNTNFTNMSLFNLRQTKNTTICALTEGTAVNYYYCQRIWMTPALASF